MEQFMIEGVVDQILQEKCGTGCIEMDGVKMESNKNIDFSNKSLLIPLFDALHDSSVQFKVVDDYNIELNIQCINESMSEKINLYFSDPVLDSFTIYGFSNEDGKFIGKIVDNGESKDLEKLKVELIDTFFTNTDIFFYSVDISSKIYGSKFFIKFLNIKSISFN